MRPEERPGRDYVLALEAENRQLRDILLRAVTERTAFEDRFHQRYGWTPTSGDTWMADACAALAREGER